MGSDYTLRNRRSSRPLTCATALYTVVAPLALVLVILGLLRNHSALPSTVRQLSSGLTDPHDAYESYSINSVQQSANCPPCAASGSGRDQHIPLDSLPNNRGNDTGLAAQTLKATTEPLPSLFLFTGILSGRGYRHRRLAVREAWANKAQIPGVSVAKFILSEDERTPQVSKEVEQHTDIVFVSQKTNYKSILYKTYYVLEYAVTNFDVKFVLKTDDDAFINVDPLMSQLHLLCTSEDCTNERIYMGKMAKESEVLLQPGHKWNNIIFHNHTGLRTYPTYAMGGGYVLSGDVADMLVTVNLKMKLKFTPIEDATLGFWLMSMDLRHIDHSRFHTWAYPCCFKPPARREGQRVVTRFMLLDEIESDLCSDDPWIVLHKIDSPTKMRFVGNRVSQCDKSALNASVIAPSIAHYVGVTGSIDAEAEEKEMQQAALAALAAAETGTDAVTDTAAQAPPAPKSHKLSADLPAAAVAAAAAGQHLDKEAVEDKSVHNDKSAAQKLSEQIVLGTEQQTVDEGQDGQAADQTQASGAVQAGTQVLAGSQQAEDVQAQAASQLQGSKMQAGDAALMALQQQQAQQQQQQQQQLPNRQQGTSEAASLDALPKITSETLLQQQLASQAQTTDS